MKIVKEFWTGQRRLWQAWWLVHMGSQTMTTVVIYFSLLIIGGKLPQISLLFGWSLFIFGVIFMIAASIIVPIVVWRCSENVNSDGWSAIARVLLAAGVLRSLGSLRNMSAENISSYFIVFAVIFFLVALTAWPKYKVKSILDKQYNRKYYITPWLVAGGYLCGTISSLIQLF